MRSFDNLGTMMRKSKWYSVDECIECGESLSFHTVMHSGACCPYCGHTERGTVCAVRPVSYRNVMPYKWYEFWKYKTKYSEQKEQ